MLAPALCTLPSRIAATPRSCAIRRISTLRPLYANDEVRAGTLRPLIWDSELIRASAIPSLKYSLEVSPVRLAKGMTASDARGTSGEVGAGMALTGAGLA